MWSSKFSVAAAVTLTVAATAAPAVAADPWFTPYTSTSIPNGSGPGPAPRGSAVADFDNDGDPDVVTISNFTLGNILFVPSNGDGTFGATSEIADTVQVQGLDAGDVNADGNADVVAMTVSEVRIRLGDGAGHFTSAGTYPLTLGGQVEPRVVDVDSDGDLDIVAPTFTAIQTLINNGSGSFSAGPTSQVLGASVLSAISPADLDHDGNADLFTVDGFSGTTFALRGNGAGGFTVSGQLYGTGFVPEDITAIDLNDDGYDDVATVGSFSFTLATGLTDGTGKFKKYIADATQFGGPGPTSATAADIDGDGRTDLVVSSLATPLPKLMVLAGNGTAKMRKVGDFAVGALPQNPLIADYDGDSDLDVVTVGPGSLSLLRNTAN
ncbi:MAG TPA: VCBS repeat-containing protein [Nocardioidaceae bacterium]|nr:VCBS repeat-containing protein [Nocardioidaceae bacterium]